MNADRPPAHDEKIADAPEAIARLRRLMLDLAVRGKLVPQGCCQRKAAVRQVASPLWRGRG
jgi:type I restriction enzyme, S subunit